MSTTSFHIRFLGLSSKTGKKKWPPLLAASHGIVVCCFHPMFASNMLEILYDTVTFQGILPPKETHQNTVFHNMYENIVAGISRNIYSNNIFDNYSTNISVGYMLFWLDILRWLSEAGHCALSTVQFAEIQAHIHLYM